MAEAKVKAIFNAARRYCVDRVEALESRSLLHAAARAQRQEPERLRAELSWDYRWAQRVRQAPPLDQLPPFPREEQERAAATWGILAAILVEIERRDADAFGDVPATRAYLLAAGQRARDLNREVSRKGGEVRVTSSEPAWGPEGLAAREEARTSYLDHVARLPPEEAAGVPAVPYRRVPSESKRQKIGRELSERWHVDPLHHYWHPLRGEETPADVLAMQDWYFHRDVGVAILQGVLLRHGVTRVWQINELRLPPEYELHPSLCEFRGSETYWSSRGLDWLVYTSHEASITFAGPWLIEELKQVWPDWEQRIYTGYEYERSSP
jgi:hypothetical protein